MRGFVQRPDNCNNSQPKGSFDKSRPLICNDSQSNGRFDTNTSWTLNCDNSQPNISSATSWPLICDHSQPVASFDKSWPLNSPYQEPGATNGGSGRLSVPCPLHKASIAKSAMARPPTHSVLFEEHPDKPKPKGLAQLKSSGASVIETMTQPVIGQNDVLMTRRGCHCPKRWLLAFSLCFMRMCQTALRQVISIALVCMTSSDSIDVTGTISNASISNQTFVTTRDTEFNWSSELEGAVLSAPFYGYLLTAPLAGFLDHALGSRLLLSLSLGLGAVLSLFTPLLTRQHPFLLVFDRALIGAATAVVKPAVFSLWTRWAPLSEQGILTAVDYAGTNLGGILTFFASGFLCTIPVDNGWPFVFYVVGLMCLLSAIGVYLTVYNSPEQHPSVTSTEREHIRDKTHSTDRGKIRAPWMKILRSTAVWAIVGAHCSHHWVLTALTSYMPMFVNTNLHYSIEKSGMLLATAFAGSMLVGILGGAAADRMRKRLKQVTIRKIFQMGGSLGLAVSLGLVSWLSMGHNAAAVIFLVLAMSLFNLTSVAYRINSMDIAPGYASFITSMSSTMATALSLTAPLICSTILKSKSPEEWRAVLILVSLVALVGGVFYAIFAQGEPQAWACETTYDVTLGENDITVTGNNVTSREERRRSMPEDCREPPASCLVLSVRRLQSVN